MNLRKLGQSDLEITPIGMGAWAIGGGKWEFAWGAQDDTESFAAIRAGLDRGINWIDTAGFASPPLDGACGMAYDTGWPRP